MPFVDSVEGKIALTVAGEERIVKRGSAVVIMTAKIPDLIDTSPQLVNSLSGANARASSGSPLLSLPPFEEAVESLRAFLARRGLPTELLFVFREDLYGTSPGELFVHATAGPASTAAAAHCARARRLGLAEVTALGGTPTLSVVTIGRTVNITYEKSGAQTVFVETAF